RSQNAARENVSTYTRCGNSNRQTEQQKIEQLVLVLNDRGLGSGDLNHDRPAADPCATTHHAIRGIDPGNGDDPFVRDGGKFVAGGHGVPARFRSVVQKVAFEAVYLQPGTVSFA